MDYEKRIEEIIRDIAKQNDALKLVFVRFANLITGKKEEYNKTSNKIQKKYERACYLKKKFDVLMKKSDSELIMESCTLSGNLEKDYAYLIADDISKMKFEKRYLKETEYWEIVFSQGEDLWNFKIEKDFLEIVLRRIQREYGGFDWPHIEQSDLQNSVIELRKIVGKRLWEIVDFPSYETTFYDLKRSSTYYKYAIRLFGETSLPIIDDIIEKDDLKGDR